MKHNKKLISLWAFCLLTGLLCLSACDDTSDRHADTEVTTPAETSVEVTEAPTEPEITEPTTTESVTVPATEPVTEETSAEPETVCSHTYGEWAENIAPTCTVSGTRSHFCTLCGEEEIEYLPAVGHTAVADARVEPTCIATGLTAGEHCEVCLAVLIRQEMIPATGHTEATVAGKVPSCAEEGLTEGKYCAICSEVLVAQTVIPATGHIEVTVDRVEPTCTDMGLTAGTVCAVCDAVLSAQEKIPALGHTAVTQTRVEPTCTEDGLTEGKYCSDCGHVFVAQTVIPATGHTEVTVPGVPATCTESGLSTGSECSVCGVVLVAREVTAALGHTYDENGVCTRCNVSPASEGLEFSSNGDGTCELIGIGTCTDTDLVIPRVSPDGDTVTSIRSFAFDGCAALTSITVPNTVTNIGSLCVDRNTFTELYFTGTRAEWHAVTRMEEYIYQPCMYDVHCSDGDVVMCGSVIESMNFEFTSNGDGTCSVSGIGTASDGVIPRYSPAGDRVVAIGDGALKGAGFMVVAIPDSVTRIGERAFEGAYFDYIVMADSVTYIGDYAFYHLAAWFITDYVCDAISNLSNLTYLGKYALAGEGEAGPSVELPDGLTSIEDGLLSGFQYTTITAVIPNSVTYIGKGIFSGWRTYAKIEYKGTMAEWRAIEKHADWNVEMYPITIICTDGEIVTGDRHSPLD